MSRLRVDLVRLAELIDRMQSVADRLGGVRSDVLARAAHVAWTGSAADAYAAAQAQWAAGAEEVHQALAALGAVARTAHENYAAAAGANRRMWAG